MVESLFEKSLKVNKLICSKNLKFIDSETFNFEIPLSEN